jgi:parvulin-like peptidyl-prolyl isomerase
MKKIAAAGALAAAGVLLLGACDTTAPGAAAIVGGRNVGVAQLTSFVHGLGPQSGGNGSAQRGALSTLIAHRVIGSAAHRHGVHATRGQVERELSQLIQRAGGRQALDQQAQRSGIPPGQLHTIVRDDVLQRGLAAKLGAGARVSAAKLRQLYRRNIAQFTTAHLAGLVVMSKKSAEEVLAEVRAHPTSFPRLARKHPLDSATKKKGGDLGTRSVAQFPDVLAKPILKAKPDSYFKASAGSSGWAVIHVISKHTKPFAQVKGQLRQQAAGPASQQRVARALTAEAKRLNITVNPRFGRWDDRQEKVIARHSEVSKPAPSGGNGAPSITPPTIPGG